MKLNKIILLVLLLTYSSAYPQGWQTVDVQNYVPSSYNSTCYSIAVDTNKTQPVFYFVNDKTTPGAYYTTSGHFVNRYDGALSQIGYTVANSTGPLSDWTKVDSIASVIIYHDTLFMIYNNTYKDSVVFAKYDETSNKWTKIWSHNNITTSGERLFCMGISNDSLYVGGTNVSFGELRKYNGTTLVNTTWQTLDPATANPTFAYKVSNLTNYHTLSYDYLIATGNFSLKVNNGADTANSIAFYTSPKWNSGFYPDQTYNKLSSEPQQVKMITCSFRDTLYLFSSSTLIYGGQKSKIWWTTSTNLNKNWHVATGYNDSLSSFVPYCAAVYHDKMYIGGNIKKINGDSTRYNGIFSFDGAKFDGLAGGLTDTTVSGTKKGIVRCLAVANEKLYIGGYFDFSGGMPVSDNIAVWSDTMLDMEVPSINQSDIVVYPIPSSDHVRISNVPVKTTYIISDISGKLINTGETNIGSIDISNLPMGSYFISLNLKTGSVVKKILKF